MIFLLQGGGWGSLQSQWASSGFPHRNLRAALTLPNPGKGSICAFLLFAGQGGAGARQVIGWGRPDEPRFFPQTRIGFPAPGTVGGYGLVSRPTL
jgi:hypothetical protein